MASIAGRRIKEIRESKKISQNKLAKLSGVSQSAISSIEGETKSPSIETIERIAVALGCSTYDIIVDDTTPPPPSEIDNAIAGLTDGLSPEEVQRVLDFIAGIKAARKG